MFSANNYIAAMAPFLVDIANWLLLSYYCIDSYVDIKSYTTVILRSDADHSNRNIADDRIVLCHFMCPRNKISCCIRQHMLPNLISVNKNVIELNYGTVVAALYVISSLNCSSCSSSDSYSITIVDCDIKLFSNNYYYFQA